MTTCQRDPVGCPFPTGRKRRKYRTRLWICPNCAQGWRWGHEYARDKWLRWPAPDPALQQLTVRDVEYRIQAGIDNHWRTYKHKKWPQPEAPKS